MIKRNFLLLFCLLAGFAALCFFALHGFPSNPTTPSQVKSKIEAQIPLGSNRKTVEAWLNSQRYQHQYRQGQKILEFDGNVSQSGHKPGQLDGYIHANVRDTRRGWMSYYYVFIDFFFDKNQKLVSYSLREQEVSK